MSTPFVPPIETEDLPALGGRIGDEPEHFVVEEIPAYEPSGEGEHAYFWVEKRLQNTRDVAGYLARAAGVHIREVGYAGLKDRRAVTRQWFSLPVRSRPTDEWQLPDGVKALAASRHKNKLRTGHLIGNRFSLGFVDVPEGGKERAERILEARRAWWGRQLFRSAALWTRRTESTGSPRLAARRRRLAAPRHRPEAAQLCAAVRAFQPLRSPATGRGGAALLARRCRAPRRQRRAFRGRRRRAGTAAARCGRHRLDRADDRTTWAQAKGAARELELEIARQLELTPELLERLGEHAPGTRRDLILVPSEVTLTELARARSARLLLPIAVRSLRHPDCPRAVTEPLGLAAQPRRRLILPGFFFPLRSCQGKMGSGARNTLFSRFATIALLAHGSLACTHHPAAINGPARGAGPATSGRKTPPNPCQRNTKVAKRTASSDAPFGSPKDPAWRPSVSAH